MYVTNRLGKYEKEQYALQPDVLLCEQPSLIGTLLRKGKNHRSPDENLLVNAWRSWRSEVWRVEGENETRLRSLFRAMVIFHRESEGTRDNDTKNKYLECLHLLDNFMTDVWQIGGAYGAVITNSWFDLTKIHRHVDGFSNEWRDPVACAK